MNKITLFTVGFVLLIIVEPILSKNRNHIYNHQRITQVDSTSNQSEQFSDELRKSLDHFVRLAKKEKGTQPSEELINTFERIKEIPRVNEEALWQYFAKDFKKIRSPLSAGYVAVVLGARIEVQGENPEPGIPHILAYFVDILKTVFNDEDEAIIDDETRMGLVFLGRSLVTHLSYCPEQKRANFFNSEIIEILETAKYESSAAAWVLEILHMRSGELIVLHTEYMVGVRVKYQNISNCFHLFSLLQIELEEVMPGAKEVKEEILEVIQSKGESECMDEAWWNYEHDEGVGEFKIRLVFGELSPETISRVNGEQVLLLSAPMGSRSWDSNFFWPYLAAAPSSVKLMEELPKEEVIEWISRLKHKP
jgi:hypothetical protein